MTGYGKELILDLHGCEVKTFTRHSIEQYFISLCDLIDMQREDLHFWDDEGVPEEEKRKEPHVEGITAVQFIITSSIVIHALTQLKAVYVNIFSCKEFDSNKAAGFTARWFQGRVARRTEVERI